MQSIEFKDKLYTYPTSYSEVTIKQRIDFHNIYGKEIEDKAKEISLVEDEDVVSILEVQLSLLTACKALSFFANIPFNEVLNNIPVETVMGVYDDYLYTLLFARPEIELRSSYEFAGEQWCIPNPILQPSSKLTLNEFITPKELVRQMEGMGNGTWQALLYLCCIYLRKKDEPFAEELLDDGGERKKLFEKLPLEIAMQVGFFLRRSMTIYLKDFPYSGVPKPKGLT
jgi:hypothetical protein